MLKDGTKVGIEAKYQNEPLIFRLHRQFEEVQKLLQLPDKKFDRLVFIVAANDKSLALNLANKIRTWTNITNNVTFIIGNLEEEKFSPMIYIESPRKSG